MRKLSEIQNEDALDVIADIIDPVIEICKDEELKNISLILVWAHGQTAACLMR